MSKRILLMGFCGVLIVFAVLMLIVAFGFDAKTVDTVMPGSRFFPFLTLSLILVFSAALIIKSLVNSKQVAEDGDDRLSLSKSEILRVVIVTALGFIGYVIWKNFGFLAISGFLIAGIGITLKVRSVWGYIILVAITVGLYFLLKSLGVPLN